MFVPVMLPSQFKIQCALYDSRWSTVNNLLTFPSKGKQVLQKAVRCPGSSIRISCITTTYGNPRKEHLRKPFASSSQCLKSTWNQLRSILSSHRQPSTTLLSSLREINFLNEPNLVFIKELLHSNKRLSCQANELLGILKSILQQIKGLYLLQTNTTLGIISGKKK